MASIVLIATGQHLFLSWVDAFDIINRTYLYCSYELNKLYQERRL
jgi:hypothetical protein